MSGLTLGDISRPTQQSTDITPGSLVGYTPQYGRIAKRVKLAQRYLPTDDPHTAALYYNLAQSEMDDDQYLNAVSKVSGFNKARRYVRMFKRLSPNSHEDDWHSAQQVWDRLDERQRDVLLAMGVKDPTIQRKAQSAGGGGLFGGIVDVVGDAWDITGAPVKTAGKVLGEVGGVALEGLAYPKRIIDTGYRVAALTAGSDNPLIAGLGLAAAIGTGAAFALTSPISAPLTIAALGAAGGLGAMAAMGGVAAAIDPERFAYAWDVAGEGGGERAVHMRNRDQALDILQGNERLLERAFDVMVSGSSNEVAFKMAEDRAAREGINQETDPERYQTIVNDTLKLVNSKRFVKAVNTLTAGKVSPGRDIAGILLKPGGGEVDIPGIGTTNIYSMLSGLTDAAWTIASDPMLIAGRATKAARIARNTFTLDDLPSMFRVGKEWNRALEQRTLTDIVRMADDSAYRDAAINEWRRLGMNDHEVWATIWMDGARGGDEGFAAAARMRASEPSFAAAFKEADFASRGGLFQNPKAMDKVLEAHPQIKAWFESGDSRLRAFARSEIEKMQGQKMAQVGGPGLTTPENFLNWLQHGKGWETVLARRADAAMAPIITKPRMTRLDQAWLDVKMPLEQRIGKWMETGGWKAHGQDIDGFTRVGNEIKYLTGKFFNDLTQHIPTRDLIDINGPQAGIQLQRFMARALPYTRRWEIYGEFMGQATPAGRRLVAQQAVMEVMNAYGLNVENAPKFVELWSGAAAGEVRALRYAINPKIDRLVIPNGPPEGIATALWKSQLADNLMAVPSLREMGKALRQTSNARKIAGAPNADIVSTFMNRIWKPMVLLRIGFIPRAAGEETLAWLAREPADIAKGWLAYPFHYAHTSEADISAPLRGLARIERRIKHWDYLDEYMPMYELRKKIAESRNTGQALTDIELAPMLDAIKDNKPWLGEAYKTTSIKDRPLFLFDPADTQGTRKLERMIQKMTRWMLDDNDMAILRDVLDHDAIVRAYMQQIAGADHYMWPTEIEARNARGEIELHTPGLHTQTRVEMIVDNSRWELKRAHEDPLINLSIDSLMAQSAYDDDIRQGVNLINVFASPRDRAWTQQATGFSVPEIQDAFARAPRSVREKFEDLYKLPSSAPPEVVKRELAGLPEDIKNIMRSEKLAPDVQERLTAFVDNWGMLDNEQRSLLMTDLRGVFGDIVGFNGRQPLFPKDAHHIITNIDDIDDDIVEIQQAMARLAPDDIDGFGRLQTALNDAQEERALLDMLYTGPTTERGATIVGSPAYQRRRELFDAARNGDAQAFDDLMHDVVRGRLSGPNASLDEFHLSQAVDGLPVARPPAQDMHRIWFPVVRQKDAAPIARTLETSASEGDAVMREAYLRAHGFNYDDLPDTNDLVPFGYWAHSDPRVAKEVADRLGGEQYAVTVGYVDVPERSIPAFRQSTDPANEFRQIHSDVFSPSKITIAPTPESVVRIGDDVHGVGPTYDDMLDDFTRRRVAWIKEQFIGDEGNLRHGLARPVGEGRWEPQYMYIDGVDIPKQTIGPSRIARHSTIWDDFVRWGFDDVIGPAIDTIVRRPMFLTSMARTRRQIMATTGKALTPDLAPVVSVMQRMGYKKDQVDDFYRVVRPTLKWAHDSGIEINTTADLLRVLERREADLFTEGLRGMTNDVKNALTRMEKEDGFLDFIGEAKQITDHPLWRMVDHFDKNTLDPAVRATMREEAVKQLALSDQEVRNLVRWFRAEDDARTTVTKLAAESAFNESIRYIDDHVIRSQFAENVRNLIPFYFAEEQFLKRWARSIAYDPAGLRRVQLLKHGLDSTGFIKTDPQSGDEYFVYPFSAEANDLMGRVSEMLTGDKHRLPVFVPLTGQVQYALPGLDNKGMPQVGPLIAAPMKAIANRFPELKKIEYEVLGERAAGLPLTSQIVPVSVKRFWDAFTARPDKSREMASVMSSVIQIMDAEGLTPPDDASGREKEQYLDRVENWTRTMMLTRAVLGFMGPAAPSSDVPGKELTVEFRDLMKNMPVSEAAATFLSANPDATAFTVFRTRTPSGAVLPTGKRTLDWFEKNDDIIALYPKAAPWLIPQEYADDEYEARVYNQQIALGLRERRLPEEMYDEIKFAKASPMYFDTKDKYDAAIAAAQGAGNNELVSRLREEYGRWKQAYLVQHPLFNEQLSSPQGRQQRAETMEQLQEMKDDPRVKRRMDPAVRDVLDAWEEYEVAYDVLRYQTGSRASQARRSLRLRIFNMLEDYTRRNRSTRALYLRLMRPELNLDEADLAVQDATSQQRSTNFQQGVDAILSRQRQTVDQYR